MTLEEAYEKRRQECLSLDREVKKIEGLCTESYIFHIHYRGQSLPVVMPYDGNNYLARKDHAELCRKLTGEKE